MKSGKNYYTVLRLPSQTNLIWSSYLDTSFTETVRKYLEEFYKAYEQWTATDVIYLDIRKALNMIIHNILLSNLGRYIFDAWSAQG